jgi:hypothetical protein
MASMISAGSPVAYGPDMIGEVQRSVFAPMTSRDAVNGDHERRLTARLLRFCADAGSKGGAGAMRQALRRLLTLHPSNPKVLGILITALGDLDDVENARKWSHWAYRVRRDSLEVAASVARIVDRFDAPGESHEIWRELVEVRPLQEWYRLGLAQALEETGPPAAAMEQLRRHLILKPDTAVAHVLLARALQHRGERESGREFLAQALVCDPHDQMNRVNAAWHRLRDEPDQAASWRAFGARWGGSPYGGAMSGVVMQCWRGPADPARRLIVRQEVGLGDQVLYSHFLPGLDALGLTGVMVAAPRLHRLFARSFPTWTMAGDISELSVRDFDAQIFAGDLGQYIRGLGTPSYLVPDRHEVMANRKRYLGLGFTRLVGFAWRGGNLETPEERRRAIPLPMLSQLFSFRDIGFVCLQHGVTKRERDFLSTHSNVIFDDAIDPLGELDRLASQIAAMDMVVTGASANTHFAAALGVRVVALLPYIAHWHWGLQGDTSPWYPTLEAVRQSQPGAWRSVLDGTARLLEQID